MATAARLRLPRAGLSGGLGLSPLPLLVAVVLATLVLPIVLVVFLASLHAGAALPFDPVPLTLENYAELLSDASTYRLLLNTVLYTAVSLAIGMCITVPLVWLVERTDLPGRTLLGAALFVPLVIPGALVAMGWVLLLAPRAGFVNVWLRGVLGLNAGGLPGSGPLDVYSFPGLVLMTGTGLVPSMFVMLSAAFRNMDAQLEEAGKASGAGTLDVARLVTLPLMLPSLTSAGIYYTILLFETFEIPLVIGLNAKFFVISTHVFQLVQSESAAPAYGQAAAIGALAIAIGIGLAALYSRISRAAYRYALIRGQRQAPRVVRLGPWRYVALGVTVLYFTITFLLPTLALVWTSLFRSLTVPSVSALQGASLEVYALLFQDPRWDRVLVNTIMVVAAASAATVVLSTLVSWVVIRTGSEWLRWLDALAFLPRAVPGVILAVGVFLLLIRTPLYATVWIIVVAHTISFLPYSVRLMSSTLLQIHKELEESARASGAGSITVLREIVFPLMRPAVLNCSLWVAAHSVRDFTFVLILGATTNTVFSQLLWQYWARGQWERTSAMAVLLIAVLLVIVLPVRYRLSRSEAL